MFLSAALALAVAGSWAFCPKAADEPGGYTMVIGRIDHQGASILTIMPDGKKSVQEVSARIYATSKTTAAYESLHEAELQKINLLKSSGWKIVSATQSGVSPNAVAENVYILEK